MSRVIFGRLRWKIMTPYLALSLGVAFLGTFLATRAVADSLHDRFTNQLVEAARVASDGIVRREREQLAVLRAIAFTEGVPETLASGDAELLARLVYPIVVNSGLQEAYVLDADGRVRFAASREPGTGSYMLSAMDDPLDGWAPVNAVLASEQDGRGDKHAGLVEGELGVRFITAGPVVNEGVLVGVVVISTPLAALAPALKEQALADVALFAPDRRLLTTTLVGDGASAIAPADRLSEGTGERRSVAVSGRDYDLLTSELRVRGQPVGYLGVALPTSFITAAGQVTRSSMTVLFSFATLAVLLVGWLTARALTQPVLRLVRTAHEVEAGDLSARSGLSGSDEIAALASSFDSMTARLERQHLSTVEALVSAIDARDPYTRGHSVRVGLLAVELGREFGLPASQLQHLRIGGYLHDIGKIGIRDSILLKQGALDPEERARIEQHPRIGLEILGAVDLAPEVRSIVGGHHERLDGSGYPLQLSEDELTVFPRIAAVADVYDALVTDRPYRAGMPLDDALKLLRREAESGLLDQDVVSAILRIAMAWEAQRSEGLSVRGLPTSLLVPVAAIASPHVQRRTSA